MQVPGVWQCRAECQRGLTLTLTLTSGYERCGAAHLPKQEAMARHTFQNRTTRSGRSRTAAVSAVSPSGRLESRASISLAAGGAYSWAARAWRCADMIGQMFSTCRVKEGVSTCHIREGLPAVLGRGIICHVREGVSPCHIREGYPPAILGNGYPPATVRNVRRIQRGGFSEEDSVKRSQSTRAIPLFTPHSAPPSLFP